MTLQEAIEKIEEMLREEVNNLANDWDGYEEGHSDGVIAALNDVLKLLKGVNE